MFSEGEQVLPNVGKKDGHLLEEAEKLTDRNDVEYNDQFPQNVNDVQSSEDQFNENTEGNISGMDNGIDYNDKFPDNTDKFDSNENEAENPEEIDDFDSFAQDGINDNSNFDESDLENDENINEGDLQNSGRNDGLENLQEYLPEDYFNEKDTSTKPPFSLDDIFNTFGSSSPNDEYNRDRDTNPFSKTNRHFP